MYCNLDSIYGLIFLIVSEVSFVILAFGILMTCVD